MIESVADRETKRYTYAAAALREREGGREYMYVQVHIRILPSQSDTQKHKEVQAYSTS